MVLISQHIKSKTNKFVGVKKWLIHLMEKMDSLPIIINRYIQKILCYLNKQQNILPMFTGRPYSAANLIGGYNLKKYGSKKSI